MKLNEGIKTVTDGIEILTERYLSVDYLYRYKSQERIDILCWSGNENGSVKQMSLKAFIRVLDLLLKEEKRTISFDDFCNETKLFAIDKITTLEHLFLIKSFERQYPYFSKELPLITYQS